MFKRISSITFCAAILACHLIGAVILVNQFSLAACFAEECILCEEDFDHDGDVDGKDLSAFTGGFGATTCCTGYSENAVYVSASNPNASDNDPEAGLTPSYPARTISFGIIQASIKGRSEVRVGMGLYSESIQMMDGISIRGGYSSDFTHRDTDTLRAIIRSDNTQPSTVFARDVFSPTVFEGFIVEGPHIVGLSTSSTGISMENCTGALTVRNNIIYAGTGGDGQDADHGAPGADGQKGDIGENCVETSTRSYTECQNDPSTPGPGGAGGILLAGSTDISGGNGADAGCPYQLNAQPSGETGHGTGGGTGGQGGNNRVLGASCTSISTGGFSSTGFPGSDGQDGSDGEAGSYGRSNQWSVSNRNWISEPGSNGVNGVPGSGGGGGGAGGGVDVAENCTVMFDTLGGAGGGGGSGGAPGSGGAGGGGAGGAFGIYAYYDTSFPTQPDISQNIIFLGRGGRGGRGGDGGVGGIKGIGGKGGSVEACQFSYTLGNGGDGGNGGSGGHGGAGGGAAGGASYGILVLGKSAPASYSDNNTFDPTYAAGGIGGPGGQSLGNSGSAGETGSVANLHSLP